MERREWLAQTGLTLMATGLARAAGPPRGSGGESRARLNPWRLQDADLRSYMLLGVRHIYRSAINRSRGCLPYVRFNLTEEPTWARHEYWGSPHMVGRFLDALAVCSPILDLPADREAVEGLQRLLHESIANPSGLAFDTLPGPDGKRTAALHHSREVLLGLLGLRTWQGSEPSIRLARRFVRRLEEVTRATGSFPSDKYSEEGWIPSPTRKLNQTSGRLIGALVKYFRATRDSLAVDLAVRFAEANIEACFTSKGELTPAAGEHLHSSEGTMTSLIDLGLLTGEQRYLKMGRLLYDVGLRRWRTSWGWAKESRNEQPGRGEANNTGDFVEAALLLGRSGSPEYFQDAERIIRNGLLASQVVTTDWIPQSSQADTKDYAHSGIRDRARGAFAFTLPNAYHSYNTDLMGGALQSLAEAYQASVVKDDSGVWVNLLFSTDTPWLRVRSEVPRAGRLHLEVLKEERVRVRLPDWIPADRARVDGAGSPGQTRPEEGPLDLGRLGQGCPGHGHLRSARAPDPGEGPGFPRPLRGGMARRYHRGHGAPAHRAHRSLLTG